MVAKFHTVLSCVLIRDAVPTTSQATHGMKIVFRKYGICIHSYFPDGPCQKILKKVPTHILTSISKV